MEVARPRPPRASALADLARQAAIRKPDSPWAKLASANSAFETRDYARASALYDGVIAAGIDPHVPWHRVCQSLLELGDPHAALAASQRGFAVAERPDNALHIQVGIAHSLLGERVEAQRHFLSAAASGNPHEACWYILFGYARERDAHAMLAQCEELEARFGQSAVFRANRAIAWSMLGDAQRAAALVDLDAHVRTGTIGEFFDGDLAEFNAALTAEALAIGAASGTEDKTIVTTPDLSGSPTILALQSLVRTAIETYLAEADARGLAECLPLPLGPAELKTGVTLLRREGRNGQHIHMSSVISAVYHVGNPAAPEASETASGAGALQLGPVSQYAGGHDACWGERRVVPQPGQLTIFPAHVFHDVVPTGTDIVRVSFPSDVHLVG